jgi:hypothetical protein
MNDQIEKRDEELGRAIEEIGVPPLSEDFGARVATVAEAERGVADAHPPGRWRRWRVAAAAAALAAVAAVVGGFIGAAVTHEPAPSNAASAPVLSFAPTSDWNSVVIPLPSNAQANDQVAWASNVPFQGSDAASDSPTDTVKALPQDGVVVQASLAHQVDDPQNYPERGLPLKLSDGYFLTHAEGQPAPNVSRQIIYAHANGQYLLIQVWFGQLKPTEAQTQSADTELARLTVPTQ